MERHPRRLLHDGSLRRPGDRQQSLFAFLVAVLLPFEAIFPLPRYSFFYADPALLAVGLLSCWAMARATVGRYAILSLASCLCFFWSPTNGVACIVALVGLLVVQLLAAEDRRAPRRALGVFLAAAAAVLSLYVAALVLHQRPLVENLRLVLAFGRAESLIGGLPAMIKDFDALAIFQYVVLPGIGVCYLAKLARQVIERRPLDRSGQLLGFLTFASFVLFARALGRHTLSALYQPFFFAFLALAGLMAAGSRPAEGAGARSRSPATGRSLVPGSASRWPRISSCSRCGQ